MTRLNRCRHSCSRGVVFLAIVATVLALSTQTAYGQNYALARPATQSSTFSDSFLGSAPASLAVDGLNDPDWWSEWGKNVSQPKLNHQSCTQYEFQPWWQVDLQMDVRVREIRIINSCCTGMNVGTILSNFYVFLSSEPFPGGFTPTTSFSPITYSAMFTSANQVFNIYPGDTRGRYVRIQLASSGFLTLPEVEVYGEGVNYAIGASISQSSTYTHPSLGLMNASYAIDGNANPVYTTVGATIPYQSRTLSQSRSYLTIDLRSLYDVRRIRITDNCCVGDAGYDSERITNAYVLASSSSFITTDPVVESGRTTVLSTFITSVTAGNREFVWDLSCLFSGSTARTRVQFIRIQLNGTGILNVAEVEVFGTPVRSPSHRYGFLNNGDPLAGMSCTSSTVLTDSALTRNATLFNGITCDGTESGSLVFDGVDDFVQIPSFTFGTTFSVSVLYRVPLTLSGDVVLVAKKIGDDGFLTRSFVLMHTTSGTLVARVYSEYDVYIGRRTSSVLSGMGGRLVRVTVTYDGRTQSLVPATGTSSVSIYVNGTQADTTNDESSTPFAFRSFNDYSFLPVEIGSQHAGSANRFAGSMFEVQFFDQVLSCESITASALSDATFRVYTSIAPIYTNIASGTCTGTLVNRVCTSSILSPPITSCDLGYLSHPAGATNNLFNFEHNSTFSVALMFQLSASRDTEGVLIGKAGSDFRSRGWYISIANLTSLRFTMRASWGGGDRLDVRANLNQSISNVTVTTGVWNVLLVTYDGTGLAAGVRIYLNPTYGTFVPLTNTVVYNSLSRSATCIESTAFATIGARNTSSNSFPGSIANVRMYNYVLQRRDVLSELSSLSAAATSTPVTQLLSVWRFDENLGTTASDSVGSNSGTLVGGSFVSGKYSNALRLSGTQYVTLPISFTVTSFSITGWFRWAGGLVRGVLNRWAIISNYNGLLSTDRQYGIFLDSTTCGGDGLTVYFFFDSGDFQKVASARSNLDDGSWHHFAGVLSAGSSARVYVDNVLEGTETVNISSLIVPTGPLFIGRDGSYERRLRFNGDLDDIRFYSGTLPASQVTCDIKVSNATAATPVAALYSSSLRSYWRFDQPTATNISDSGVQANHGTLTRPSTFNNWPSGQTNTALCFDGTSSFVNMTANPTYTNFSVSMWVKWNGGIVPSTVSNRWAIMSGHHTTTTRRYWGLHLSTTKVGPGMNLLFFYNNGVTGFQSVSGNVNDFDTGSWRHIVATFRGGVSASVFVDGVLDLTSTTSIPATIVANTQLYMGRDGLTELRPRLNGCIDEAMIWNQFFLPADVTAIYANALATLSSAVVGAGVVSSSLTGTTSSTTTKFAPGQSPYDLAVRQSLSTSSTVYPTTGSASEGESDGISSRGESSSQSASSESSAQRRRLLFDLLDRANKNDASETVVDDLLNVDGDAGVFGSNDASTSSFLSSLVKGGRLSASERKILSLRVRKSVFDLSGSVGREPDSYGQVSSSSQSRRRILNIAELPLLRAHRASYAFDLTGDERVIALSDAHCDAATAMDRSGEFTLEAWVMVNENGAGSEQVAASCPVHYVFARQGSDPESTSGAFRLCISAEGLVSFEQLNVNADGEIVSIRSGESSARVRPGVWTHLSGVWSADEQTIVVGLNGVFESVASAPVDHSLWSSELSFPAPATLSSSQCSLVLGDSSEQTFAGLVDSVRLWASARTENDLQTSIILSDDEDVDSADRVSRLQAFRREGLVAEYNVDSDVLESTTGLEELSASVHSIDEAFEPMLEETTAVEPGMKRKHAHCHGLSKTDLVIPSVSSMPAGADLAELVVDLRVNVLQSFVRNAHTDVYSEPTVKILSWDPAFTLSVTKSSNGVRQFVFSSGGGVVYSSPMHPISYGTWYHVTVMWRPGHLRFMLNGGRSGITVVDGSDVFLSAQPADAGVRVSSDFHGSIDDVTVTPALRSSSVVASPAVSMDFDEIDEATFRGMMSSHRSTSRSHTMMKQVPIRMK